MTASTVPTVPTMLRLTDRWGRTADDLRISLIDKCNLRCTYCMPAEGLPWLKKDELLTADEAVRLADIGVRVLGVKDIRFTGGEPLVRKDLADIIRGVRTLHPEVSISITTNGIGLDKRIDELVEAGLTRVNVSLDTVDREAFTALTRRDRLPQVMAGLKAAKDAGLEPVKVNAVMMRGVNDHGAVDLAQWCLDHGYQLRFIEQMPLDADRSWARENLVSGAEIRSALSERFVLREDPAPRGSAPAQLWEVCGRDGARLGTVGIIASVTESFCAACSRTRITADGKIRSCLFSNEETDLMGLLRGNASDEDVALEWSRAMWGKPRAYGSDEITLNDEGYVQPERTMSAIGG
ncbi:Putative molybdopterin cofactor synthesis protein A [Corynebacterium glyciniphilum AJ 3170]|uniref:GTP 3',8-cyclase n=2 Tax=Corynebacterium TaxID=1716 RepID=X5DJC8_9CORY|nr:GTP 3',8-cyclase MoaA [Corynebacterium glyciniphilum]AHW63193.1 Putative molybdopterin cofactor synthesis protein A [Corynebacterium glyciniphilum AJ 3170]